MNLREIEVGQTLKPIPGSTIDCNERGATNLSERYKVTKKLRDCVLAMNSKGHTVVVEVVHLCMLQPSVEFTGTKCS